MQNKTFLVEFKDASGSLLDTHVVDAMISEIAVTKAEQLTGCDWSRVSIRQIEKAPAVTDANSNLNPIFKNILDSLYPKSGVYSK